MSDVKAKAAKATPAKTAKKVTKADKIAANKAAGKSTGPVDALARAERAAEAKAKPVAKAADIRPVRPTTPKKPDRDVSVLDAVLKRMETFQSTILAVEPEAVMRSIAVQFSDLIISFDDPGSVFGAIVNVAFGDAQMTVCVNANGLVGMVEVFKAVRAENDFVKMLAVVDPREDAPAERKAHAKEVYALKKTITLAGRDLASWIVGHRDNLKVLRLFGVTIKHGTNALLREHGYAAYVDPLA